MRLRLVVEMVQGVVTREECTRADGVDTTGVEEEGAVGAATGLVGGSNWGLVGTESAGVGVRGGGRDGAGGGGCGGVMLMLGEMVGITLTEDILHDGVAGGDEVLGGDVLGVVVGGAEAVADAAEHSVAHVEHVVARARISVLKRK